MIHTLDTILPKLPKREYWFSEELAEAFGVSQYAIQRVRKLKGLGRRVSKMRRGTFAYTLADVKILCSSIVRGK